jgi:hypothetical protein
MSTRSNPPDRNSISVGGNVTGNVVAGDQNTVGDVVLGNKVTADLRPELIELLATLRARLEAVQGAVPKYEAIIENIDDLSAEAAKPEREAEPTVARRLWQKIRQLLTGAAGTSAEVAKLTTDLTKIGEAVNTLFGPS